MENQEQIVEAGLEVVKMVKEGKLVELDCKGKGSVDQTIKILAFAREKLQTDGIDISVEPDFKETDEGIVMKFKIKVEGTTNKVDALSRLVDML